MRVAAVIVMLASAGWAQFKSTAPLVVAPTTVTDSKGHYVDGLTPADLILYDNNVPQKIQMDWMMYPIDLVVAVQTADNSGAVIDKLGGAGILFTQLLAADAGETAVISFGDEVKVHQDFTGSADLVIHALRMLRKEGGDGHALDALREALLMLEKRPSGRRRIILMIAEKRDHGSQVKLPDVMEQTERLNAAIYWLTYSPMLQPFTVRPKTVEDEKPEAERIKVPQCSYCPAPDDTPVPPDLWAGRAHVFDQRIGAVEVAGPIQRLHQGNRWTNPEFLEEERLGGSYSTGRRGGAPPVHSQLRAKGRRAREISRDPGGSEGSTGAACQHARWILGFTVSEILSVAGQARRPVLPSAALP